MMAGTGTALLVRVPVRLMVACRTGLIALGSVFYIKRYIPPFLEQSNFYPLVLQFLLVGSFVEPVQL